MCGGGSSDGRMGYIQFFVLNQQTSVFSNKSMVYKLKKYILNLSKKNTRFFCTRFDHESTRVKQFFVLCSSYIMVVSSLLVLYRLCLAWFLQIAKFRANLKFENINIFRCKKHIIAKHENIAITFVAREHPFS